MDKPLLVAAAEQLVAGTKTVDFTAPKQLFPFHVKALSAAIGHLTDPSERHENVTVAVGFGSAENGEQFLKRSKRWRDHVEAVQAKQVGLMTNFL